MSLAQAYPSTRFHTTEVPMHSLRSLRFSLFLAIPCLISCTQDHIAVMPTTTSQAGAEADVPGPAQTGHWAGRFQISGAPSQDDCGGSIILAAEHVRIDSEARTLEADVVDRRFDMSEMTPERIVAEGRFATDVCQQSTLFERFTLQRNGDAWTGTLESTWPDPNDCERACTVRFELNATRLPE